MSAFIADGRWKPVVVEDGVASSFSFRCARSCWDIGDFVVGAGPSRFVAEVDDDGVEQVGGQVFRAGCPWPWCSLPR